MGSSDTADTDPFLLRTGAGKNGGYTVVVDFYGVGQFLHEHQAAAGAAAGIQGICAVENKTLPFVAHRQRNVVRKVQRYVDSFIPIGTIAVLVAVNQQFAQNERTSNRVDSSSKTVPVYQLVPGHIGYGVQIAVQGAFK